MEHLVFFLLIVCAFQLVFSADPPAPSTLGNYLSQDFNGLSNAPSGTTLPFTQGVSLPGWWSNQDQLIVSDGGSNAGALYSFGEERAPDRSLGVVTSNKKKTIIFGTSLASAETINEITLSFIGEQWRYGGDIPDNSVLLFDFSVMTVSQYNGPDGWGALGSTTLWTPVPELSFVGNTTVNNTVGPVRGKQGYSTTLKTPNMGSGKVLQLRWTSHNGRDGLSIDDLQIVTTFAPNPNPNPNIPQSTANIWKGVAYVLGGLFGLCLIILAVISIQWRRSVRSQYRPVENGSQQTGMSPTPDLGIWGKMLNVKNNLTDEQLPLVTNLA